MKLHNVSSVVQIAERRIDSIYLFLTEIKTVPWNLKNGADWERMQIKNGLHKTLGKDLAWEIAESQILIEMKFFRLRVKTWTAVDKLMVKFFESNGHSFSRL